MQVNGTGKTVGVGNVFADVTEDGNRADLPYLMIDTVEWVAHVDLIISRGQAMPLLCCTVPVGNVGEDVLGSQTGIEDTMSVGIEIGHDVDAVRVFNPRMDRTTDIRDRRSRHQLGVNGRDTTGRRPDAGYRAST